jgi:hypothetical protein
MFEAVNGSVGFFQAGITIGKMVRRDELTERAIMQLLV